MRLENVSKKYITSGDEVEALRDLSYSFPRKGMVAITGKSGCGKTTLLHIIAGLLECDKGTIEDEAVCISEFSEMQWDDFRNAHIGIIFQDYQLLEDKTVEDNLRIVLDIRLDHMDENHEIEKVLSYVDLEHYQKRKITELSGGQKQRVAIARALIKNVNIILADEPTGHLDERNSLDIWELLKTVAEEKLVIVVTHDKNSAEKFADTILEMKGGEIVSCRDNETKHNNVIVSYDTGSKKFSERDATELFYYIRELCAKGIKKINVDYIMKESIKNIEHQSNKIVANTNQIKAMPVRRSIGYAWDSMKNRKLRHVIAVIMIALTMFLAVLDVTICSFNYYDVLEMYLEEYSFPYMKLGYTTNYTDLFFEQYSDVNYSGKRIRKTVLNNYKQDAVYGVVNNTILESEKGIDISGVNLLYGGIVKNLQIKGSFPSNANEIVITDFISNRLGLDEQLNSKVYMDDKEFVVTGIITTDYREYEIIEKMVDQNVSAIGQYKYAMDYCIAIVNTDYKKSIVESTNELSLKGSDFSKAKKLSLYLDMDLSYGSLSNFPCPITYGRMPANDNEVIISESMLNYLGFTLEDFESEVQFEETLRYSFINLHEKKYGDYYNDVINFYEFFPQGIRIVGIFDEMSGLDSPYVLVMPQKWEELKENWSVDYYYTDYFIGIDNDKISEFVQVMEENDLYWEVLWSSFFVTLRPNFCYKGYATP